MKYEKPIMAVSIFDTENIVTNSTTTNLQAAESQADTQVQAINNGGDSAKMAAKISVTF